jgi:hypothetical protein
MDRMHMFAVMAALTAGSIVTFECLWWSDSREKLEAMPAVKITTETPEALTPPSATRAVRSNKSISPRNDPRCFPETKKTETYSE